MNAPAPDTAASREDFVQRHLKFNLLAYFIDGSGWWLAMSFFNSQTILPYFVQELGGGDVLVGLLATVSSLGYLLPQLFIAPYTERRHIQKHFVVRCAWGERAAIGLLAPLTYFLARPAPELMLVCFFLCIGANALLMGSTMPGYSTMFTKTVPVDVRGRFWGISGGVAALIAMGGAALSAWLLKTYGMPTGFTLCFLIGFVIMAVTVVPLGWIREPEALETPHHPGFRAYLSETRSLIKGHPEFRRLILADMLFALTSVAAAFYTVYAVNRYQAGAIAVGHFTTTLLAASVVGGFIWGYVSDRFGNRKTLLFSSAFYMAAPVLALFAPTLLIFPAVFFLSALASSAFELGMFNITLEFAGETKVATFQGVRALAVAPARAVFPLAAGMTVEGWGYGGIFVISALAGVGVILLLRSLPDPRHHPVGYQSGAVPGLPLDPDAGRKESDRAGVEG